jgi:hypothetical protein
MTEFHMSMVSDHGGHRVLFDVDGTELETPPIEHIAFYVGVGVMVGLGLIELPIAAALTVGHVLIGLTHRPGLEALGAALEEA